MKNKRVGTITIIVLIAIVIIGFIYLNSSTEPIVAIEKKIAQPVPVAVPVIEQKNKVESYPEIDEIEKAAVKKDTSNAFVAAEKQSEIKETPPQPDLAKQNIMETYRSPYFSISYSTEAWECAEGKSMDLPSYVDVPKKVAVGTVQFINKHNGNSIFLHISSSGGADFNKMTDAEIVDYLQFIYDDYRIQDIPLNNIADSKFALLEFTPRNNSNISVKQYLTTKDNYLYSISFIESIAEPISAKMVDQVLGSMKVGSENENRQIAGGWYPVFFNRYDQAKVDSIIDSIINGRVKRINITYDNNKVLAEQVKEGIQKELNFAVKMEQVKPKDTKTVKFEHDRVVVTVYQ